MPVDSLSRVHESVNVPQTATIGPFSFVGEGVKLGENVEIMPGAYVVGDTIIGEGSKIYPYAVVGIEPQDMKYEGERTRTIIGARCIIREHATVHAGTKGGGGVTRIGDDCVIMVGSHVAHDCILGKGVILVNTSGLAGHVEVGDFAVIGGVCAVHQFVRIGAHSMIGMMSTVVQDVPPFSLVHNERAELAGINLTGIRRRGFSSSDVKAIKNIYNDFYFSKEVIEKRIEKLRATAPQSAAGQDIIDFLTTSSKRGILRPASTIKHF